MVDWFVGPHMCSWLIHAIHGWFIVDHLYFSAQLGRYTYEVLPSALFYGHRCRPSPLPGTNMPSFSSSSCCSYHRRVTTLNLSVCWSLSVLMAPTGLEKPSETRGCPHPKTVREVQKEKLDISTDRNQKTRCIENPIFRYTGNPITRCSKAFGPISNNYGVPRFLTQDARDRQAQAVHPVSPESWIFGYIENPIIRYIETLYTIANTACYW